MAPSSSGGPRWPDLLFSGLPTGRRPRRDASRSRPRSGRGGRFQTRAVVTLRRLSRRMLMLRRHRRPRKEQCARRWMLLFLSGSLASSTSHQRLTGGAAVKERPLTHHPRLPAASLFGGRRRRLLRALPSRATRRFRPKRQTRFRAKGREDRVAFRFPAKRLAACYPAFATWQGCSSSCTHQPTRRRKNSHERGHTQGNGRARSPGV